MVKPVEDYTGGSFIGYLYISYADLVETLGLPNAPNDGYKTDAEWAVELDDGTKVSIYNYKDGKNYNGDEGDDVENITLWHIGGDRLAVEDASSYIVDNLKREISALLKK